MQDSKFEGEGLSEYLPMSCLKTDKTFKKYVPLVVHWMHFIFLFVLWWIKYGLIIGDRHPLVWFTRKVQVCETHDPISSWDLSVPFHLYRIVCRWGFISLREYPNPWSGVGTSTTGMWQFLPLHRSTGDAGVVGVGSEEILKLDGLTLNLGLRPVWLCDLEQDVQLHSASAFHQWSRNNNTLVDYFKG